MSSTNPLDFRLPASMRHDSCPVQARVLALEGRMDAITDEVRSLSTEVRDLALDLRTSIKRSEALSIEMGSQLKRYAEYTDRNLKQDERGAALEQRLLELVGALREMASPGSKRKAKK
jgi:hypothetical protein